METKTITTMDYGEFEQLIIDNLRNGVDGDASKGKEFSIVAMEEWNNNEDHHFYNVKKTDYLKRFKSDLEEVNKFISTGEWGTYKPGAYVLMEYLVYKEILPEGDYLIEVSW